VLDKRVLGSLEKTEASGLKQNPLIKKATTHLTYGRRQPVRIRKANLSWQAGLKNLENGAGFTPKALPLGPLGAIEC
jgi:hypothetical protein